MPKTGWHISTNGGWECSIIASAAVLLAALTVTVIAAWHPLKDATPIKREPWFMPMMAGAIALGVFCLGYVFLGVYPIGNNDYSSCQNERFGFGCSSDAFVF